MAVNRAKKTKQTKSLSRSLLLSLGVPSVFIPGLILASVLGWNWQKDLAKLSKSGYQNSKIIFPEEGVVKEVIDGDTLELASGQTVRLIGINAPNRGESGYEEAKKTLTNLVDGEEIMLEYDRYQDDKFGRLLAYVFESCRKSWGCRGNKRLVNQVLVHEGLATPEIYQDRAKLKYQIEILKAVP